MGSERAKVSFHLASIPRPQDVYRIMVNNVNKPFEHVWLPISEDGSRFIHPLNFVDQNTRDIKPVMPPPVESTPFKLVEEVKDLKELAAKLQDASEFAVLYSAFNLLVMHGADKDILWLQRDFGIYVCNMFDTGQASRVLNLERNSLEFLLLHFCGVSANKEYQTADWRLRPLTDEMLRYNTLYHINPYAREDTHYLLHIYDVMRIALGFSYRDLEHPDALIDLYQKDVLTEYSYLNIYGLHAADFNGQQLAIVAGLCEWRDIVARAEDESTGYVLPNKSLIEIGSSNIILFPVFFRSRIRTLCYCLYRITMCFPALFSLIYIAKHMPLTTGDLRRLLRFKHPHVERNLGAVVSVIQHSMRNAAAFENMANKIKQERLQMVSIELAFFF
ncbi:3'-5' exonuclease domain-containing protein [Cynara cardunculus var. scolymus]|uniref:3'-5' exonuclease domain-containing protein n=1 Tax=Cynara cardunculus var. scolymus TaxID=59895 RepID=A0A103XGW9_CYNCS|nr:3'-5' exonuclease domain-containing protein [Cynara cardunculus var. scolymus]